MGRNVVILRRLILATVAFIVLTVVLGAAFPSLGRDRLPPELLAIVAKFEEQEMADAATTYFAAVLVWVAAIMISLIGLWWVKRWARLLFTISIAAGIPLILAMPSSAPAMFVQTPLDNIATTVLSLLNGATLALIWLGMEDAFAENHDG